MSTSTAFEKAVSDREKFIQDDLLPKMSMMKRYLGNVDFNTEFSRRKQRGQTSWEFEDRDTKAPFEGMIIGEIADATLGTNLKGKGNFKAPKFNLVSSNS